MGKKHKVEVRLGANDKLMGLINEAVYSALGKLNYSSTKFNITKGTLVINPHVHNSLVTWFGGKADRIATQWGVFDIKVDSNEPSIYLRPDEITERIIEKPPLGLTPKFIVDERRLKEVRGAIVRRYDADCEIPVKWIEEYNELIKTTK